MAFEGTELNRTGTRLRGMRDVELDYQLLRVIGLAEYGGSSVGECMAAAAGIAEGDFASWVKSFSAMGHRAETRGRSCLSAGHLVSARDQLFRASTYYRAAEVFAEFDPQQRDEDGARARQCFEEAAALADPPVERIDIPYEDALLAGYLVRPTRRSGRAKSEPLEHVRQSERTIIAIGGFDSTPEELYFQLGIAAIERGWNLLLFDAPGQIGCMRTKPDLTLRPDYGAVLTAVLDALEVCLGALGQVALVGMSLGSYLAACGAACDGRLSALVLDPPVTDLYRYLRAFLGSRAFASVEDLRPEDVEGVPVDLVGGHVAWGIRAVCRRFGVRSFQEWKRSLEAYRLEREAAKISCPVLGVMGANEGAEVSRQAHGLVNLLGADQVSLITLGVEEGADSHCQVANRRLATQVVFDWLDDRLGA